MSEKDLNLPAEDRRILELVDGLQSESLLLAVPTSAPHEAGASDELDRPYLELLGIMPYALVRTELPKEFGEKILSDITQIKVEPAKPPEPAMVAPLESDTVSQDRQTVDHRPAPYVNRWLLPVAAALTALFVGLSTWQFYKIEEQNVMIEEISSRLSAQMAQDEALVAVETQLASTNTSLALVTNPGVEICALRPVGPDAVYPAARGILYVAENHQHWYLAMEGLQPRPRGECYQLWFHAGDRAVDAGTFRVVSGTKIELSSESMPLGTTAVSITIEPAGGMPNPTGQRVLYGSEVMQIF